MRLLNFNNIPFPINPYLRPAINPDRIIYTDPKLAPGGAGPGDAPEPPPTVSAYTGAGRCSAASGLGRAAGHRQGLYAPRRQRSACHPVARAVPARADSGPPHIISNVPAGAPSVDGMLLRRHCGASAAARPQRAAVACGRGAAIMIRRMKRLVVVGVVPALTLTGCSFQGVNSLPLPGAVGRGPDAVTYHVEVAECRHAGVEFAGDDQ